MYLNSLKTSTTWLFLNYKCTLDCKKTKRSKEPYFHNEGWFFLCCFAYSLSIACSKCSLFYPSKMNELINKFKKNKTRTGQWIDSIKYHEFHDWLIYICFLVSIFNFISKYISFFNMSKLSWSGKVICL